MGTQSFVAKTPEDEFHRRASGVHGTTERLGKLFDANPNVTGHPRVLRSWAERNSAHDFLVKYQTAC